MAHFSVIEDDGGGLTLFAFADASRAAAVYAHSVYELNPSQLLEDIAALDAGDDPTGWDGGEPDPQGLLASMTALDSRYGGWMEIANETGFAEADAMGYAGQSVFHPEPPPRMAMPPSASGLSRDGSLSR